MRQRLSWNEEKVAEIMKQADPYTMNQDRKNPPVEKYETGNPSAWAEDQNKNTPWKNEGRTETGHPAPAREAVVQARKLEDKALKCITIAQRMLPGALDEMVEDQATDLMFLPEKSIMATLQRQSDLATKIAGEMKDEDESAEKKEDEEEKDASKCKKEDEEEVEAAKKKEDEEVEAKKAPKEEEVEVKAKKEEVEEKDAAKCKKDEEEVEAKAKKDEEVEEKDAAKAKKEDEEEVEAKKKVDPKEEEVKASDKDLLDILFDNAEVAAATEAAAPKTGVKKLSGLVKQASGSDPLDNLWDTPPDVSSVFK